MAAKHGLSYSVAKNASEELTHIIVKGELSDQIIKELQTASRWSFAKAMENENKQQQ
jgi:hypothetical protein